MSEDRNIVGRLESLKARLILALQSDEKPVWLHWTDIQVIDDSIEDINAANKRLKIVNEIGLRGRI